MTIITRFVDGRVLVDHSALGTQNYASGGIPVTITDLRRAETVLQVHANTGLVIEPVEYGTGNIVNLICRYTTGELTEAEIPDDTELTGVTFDIRVVGY